MGCWGVEAATSSWKSQMSVTSTLSIGRLDPHEDSWFSFLLKGEWTSGHSEDAALGNNSWLSHSCWRQFTDKAKNMIVWEWIPFVCAAKPTTIANQDGKFDIKIGRDALWRNLTLELRRLHEKRAELSGVAATSSTNPLGRKTILDSLLNMADLRELWGCTLTCS
jgi:hypothetical protein